MTKTKQVTGAMFNGERLQACAITVRVTSDQTSTTVSFSNEQTLMLQVDYGDLKELLP